MQSIENFQNSLDSILLQSFANAQANSIHPARQTIAANYLQAIGVPGNLLNNAHARQWIYADIGLTDDTVDKFLQNNQVTIESLAGVKGSVVKSTALAPYATLTPLTLPQFAQDLARHAPVNANKVATIEDAMKIYATMKQAQETAQKAQQMYQNYQ